MKRIGFFSLLFSSLVVLALTPLAQADRPESSASGKVRFLLPGGLVTRVAFSAKLHRDGTTTGQMIFSDSAEAMAQKVDRQSGDSQDVNPGNFSSEFYFNAAFDCMVVNGSRAVMGGAVTESNSERYVGRRVLLVVQDAGDGNKADAADRLTWGIYNSVPHRWISSDSELESDIGSGTTWLATDSERGDDVGVSSDKSEFTGCESFPLSSFSLMKVKSGQGDIQVRP